MAQDHFDVVVVGAGMVGGTLAQALAQSGFTVAVVERGGLEAGWDAQQHDLRVSAVNLGSERLLKAVGAWPTIQQHRVSRYLRMFVWDAGGDARIEFDCADLGVTHLGTIVENSLIVCAARRRLSADANVTVMADTGLSAVTSDDRGVSVELTSGDKLRGLVLVGADGSGSQVRSLLRVQNRAQGFGQLGIVAQVGTELDHGSTAWQRFHPTGPLAFLPLSNGDCSIVWSCERALAEQLMVLDDAEFGRRLTDAFESRLGTVTAAGPRKTFDLVSAHADRYVHGRSVLVGDAAHVVHPLAGQGVNLGLADAATLAEVLADARANGIDIGGRLTLRRYERWRKGGNLAMVYAMRGLNTLFGSDQKAVARLRGLGLRLTDRIDPVKHMFARQAMGVSGDLPQVMQPGHRLDG